MGTPTNIKSFLVLALLACLYLVVSAPSRIQASNNSNTVSNPETVVSNRLHKNGFQKTYKSYNDQDKLWSYHIICKTDEGKFEDYILKEDGQVLPPFQPEDGTNQSLLDWLTNKQKAVEITPQELPDSIVLVLRKIDIPNLPK